MKASRPAPQGAGLGPSLPHVTPRTDTGTGTRVETRDDSVDQSDFVGVVLHVAPQLAQVRYQLIVLSGVPNMVFEMISETGDVLSEEVRQLSLDVEHGGVSVAFVLGFEDEEQKIAIRLVHDAVDLMTAVTDGEHERFLGDFCQRGLVVTHE
jgi:hypothetical protein